MLRLILLLLVIPLVDMTAVAQSVIVCTFGKSALVEQTSSGMLKAETSEETLRIIFAGIDGNEPVMKGNMGESRLEIVRREPNAIWLAEQPRLGGVNLFAVFPKSHVAIMSKQYLMPGEISGDKIGPDRPFGLMMIASCE